MHRNIHTFINISNQHWLSKPVAAYATDFDSRLTHTHTRKYFFTNAAASATETAGDSNLFTILCDDCRYSFCF